MKLTAEKICSELGLDLKEILNIYPYGSKIYGTDTKDSDDDFVIVYKRSLLPSGSFKDNAISSRDWTIQGTCYSRGGFRDAINNYQINALECVFLPEDKIIQEKMKFEINKFDKDEFARKIITTSSSSWHLAKLSYRDRNFETSIKNIYHVIRILEFGLQIKNHGKIVDYGCTNQFKEDLRGDINYNPKNYFSMFMDLCKELKE